MARSKAGDPGNKHGDGPWKTALTSIEPNRILIRGYPIDEIMGRLHFGETIYLLLTGELPPPSIGRLVDAMLVSFIDHGATPPSTLAARNAATTGATLRGCLATGVLAFGKYYGGDILACRELLDAGLTSIHGGTSESDAADHVVSSMAATGTDATPGFGHRFHATDPRAIRLLQLAHELEVGHEYTQFLRCVERAFAHHEAFAGRALPINIDGAVAAVCGDIGIAPEVADALIVVSRLPGLAAHVLEEQLRETPMRVINPADHVYDGPQERRLPDRRK
jgi:citrate synthase